MIMPIGAQMAQLHQLNIPMPDVVQNNPTDSQQVSSVKNIIRRMIKYESNERCQMRQVVASLEEIGGLYFFVNHLFYKENINLFHVGDSCSSEPYWRLTFMK